MPVRCCKFHEQEITKSKKEAMRERILKKREWKKKTNQVHQV